VIFVDANLLVYAIDSDSPHHRKARRWLQETLSSETSVGLAWLVILAFLRVVTRSGILRRPLSPERAIEYVDEWLKQPYVQLVVPSADHWHVLRSLLRVAGTAGNLTSDAHLAALALERGATVCSTDNDFKRFPGLEHVNPLR
jgi:toxin-antitoxin system PIN domain toxin